MTNDRKKDANSSAVSYAVPFFFILYRIYITDQIYSNGHKNSACNFQLPQCKLYILTLDTADNQKESSYKPNGHWLLPE